MRPITTAAAVLASLLVSLAAFAQDAPQSQPAPTSAPSETQPVLARVIELNGTVEHKPLDGDTWEPCKVDDEYPQETVIRTGIRSSAKFQIGSEAPYTAMVVESATKTVISEAYRTQDTKRVRIGIGYGRIRAGVAEGGLRSDFTVDSPVATLSKRGTWDFGMFYERGTERFEVFLLDRGLVEAINDVTGTRRGVLPGEVLTNTMRRWLDEAQIRSNVAVADILGQGSIDIAFNRMRMDGLGILNPASGQQPILDLTNPGAKAEFAQLLEQRFTATTPVLPNAGTLTRREGFFGTGRGDQLIPVIISANSSLVQKGFARPGTYQFRADALGGWLRNYQGARK